ncbi:MAG: hypothetical protein F6K50_10190 [Moorea sp. SIO3I7]|uniref:hypothetical protein n=1 Tax=Moorena sp. SIO3I8 TaxID=2607833 RepID=UPI0013C24105|nr:hypothetical protein [Moorena sp. SIO3I8]NEN95884.1 hypothetical protein [Moorena sp. SIO3I7]NEO05128.1 hypothetical protein [Moorena sp. SIO3I8]
MVLASRYGIDLGQKATLREWSRGARSQITRLTFGHAARTQIKRSHKRDGSTELRLRSHQTDESTQLLCIFARTIKRLIVRKQSIQ